MFDYNDLVLQLVTGLFFTVTGYRKVFLPAVRHEVWGLFDKLHVPGPARPLVVGGELAGGLGLLTGTLSTWAAVGLLPIMLGAYVMDTIPTVKAKHPQGVTAWISKLLCTPEALLILVLVDLAVIGWVGYD